MVDQRDFTDETEWQRLLQDWYHDDSCPPGILDTYDFHPSFDSLDFEFDSTTNPNSASNHSAEAATTYAAQPDLVPLDQAIPVWGKTPEAELRCEVDQFHSPASWAELVASFQKLQKDLAEKDRKIEKLSAYIKELQPWTIRISDAVEELKCKDARFPSQSTYHFEDNRASAEKTVTTKNLNRGGEYPPKSQASH